MAGTIPTITPGNIAINAGLSDRPVYFVTVAGQDLVIKGDAALVNQTPGTEADAQASIKWGSKLMKGVNNQLVNIKVMSPAEVAVFKAAARARFFNTPTDKKYLNVADPGPAYTWVKMPRIPGLTDADLYVKNGNFKDPVPDKIKYAFNKLSDRQTWFDIGVVVAVDIFNGNNDRFGVPDGAWVNEGNVMFAAGIGVIGLDTFDPNSPNANHNQGPPSDNLRILTDPVKMKAFAAKCVAGVGESLSREMKTANMATVATADNEWVTFTRDFVKRAFALYADDMERGLAEGALRLKNVLQAKVRKYRQAAGQPWQQAQGARPQQGGGAGFQIGAGRVRPGQPAVPNMPALPPAPNLPPLPAIPQAQPANPWQAGRGVLPQGGARLQMGGNRVAQPQPAPAPQLPGALPPQGPPVKTIPQGILDKMTFLGWNV